MFTKNEHEVMQIIGFMGDQLILDKKSKDLNTLYTGEECWTLFGATLRSPSILSPLGAMRGPLGGIPRYFRETCPLLGPATLHQVPSRYQPGFKRNARRNNFGSVFPFLSG